MNNKLATNLGLFLLRVVISAGMLTHGYPKLQRLMDGNFSFADPFGIGPAPSLVLTVIGEFVAPILIILGFQTRLASIPAAITMAVAAFMIHGDDPFSKQEKAILYLVGFLVLALMGGGKWGIDGAMGKKG